MLDEVLTEIFTNEESIMIGFSFASDSSVFKKCLPKMTFYQDFTRIVDAQTLWSKIMPDANDLGLGLAKVCEHILDTKLCKAEQMSNWERRPLRQTQSHYASLDAYVMIPVLKGLAAVKQQEPTKAWVAECLKPDPNAKTSSKKKSKKK